MRELPKSVVERLKSAPPSTAHPDADLLTALSEKALAGVERATVLEHVARCSECRDIVSLALPAVLEGAAPVVRLRRLWGWPVLRGAAFAAAVITVAAVGIFYYQHHTPANTIVARSIPHDKLAAPSAPAESDSAAPGVHTEAPPAPTRQEGASSISPANNVRSGPNDALKRRARAAVGSLSDRAGAGPTADTKIAMAKSPREFDLALSPQAPSAQTGKQVPATGSAPPSYAPMKDGQHVQAEALPVESRSTLFDAQTAELRGPIESTDNVTRAKPAATSSGAASAGLPMVARKELDLQQFQKAPMPRWTITSTGGLQRSLDGGQTWEDVNVYASPGVYGGPVKTTVISGNASDKTAAKDEKKIAAPQSAATPLFRAIAAIGNEVWAGASGGLLYHSADAGANWNSISLSERGIPMSGDIVRIEFPDSLHGRITTSAYETWITSDGGQSWNKQ